MGSKMDTYLTNTVIPTVYKGATPFQRVMYSGVRIVDKDGEPWWVAKDVCEILELGNPRSSLALLEDDEKSSVQIMDGNLPSRWKPEHDYNFRSWPLLFNTPFPQT